MKALVLHGPEDYRVESDWPDPEPREGWAIVRVRYAGICGSDLPRFGKAGSYHHPMILGHEFSGTIAEPAAGSSRFRAGDPVAILPIIPCGHCEGCAAGEPFHCRNYLFLGSRIDGGFAEYCAVPEQNLFPLPPGVDLRVGAFIEPIAVGLHVLRRSGFEAGKDALVLGAGPIGILVALWLRVFAASRILIADLRRESLEIARRAGLGEAVDPSGLAGEGSELPMFDAAFEAAGAAAALALAVDRVRDKGSLTVVGRDTADTVIPLRTFERLMRKELTLNGCWGYNLRGEETFLHGRLAAGDFPVGELITHQAPLDEAPRLIRAMLAREMYYCKVLVEV